MTQAELGARVGTSGPAVRNWESGSNLPKRENMDRLVEVLGVTEAQLFEREEFAQEFRLAVEVNLDEVLERLKETISSLQALASTVHRIRGTKTVSSSTIQGPKKPARRKKRPKRTSS